MAEESAAPSTSADKTESMDVDGEAKKLLGLGQKNLVMGDIPAAVNAFQEAASLLGGKYGETADECAEAFFFYGKSLLELARMENGVLGNALEGVQVEEEEEKTEDATVESTDNIDEEEREELREQVYNAMGEKDESGRTGEEPVVKTEAEMQPKTKNVEMEDTKEEALNEPAVDVDHNIPEEKKEEQEKTEKQVEAVVQEKEEGSGVSPEDPLEDDKARDEKPVAEEKASKEKERPEMAEKALEDTTVKKGTTALEMTSGEAKSLVKEMPEAAGKDTVEKQVTAEGEDKAVIEKAEEKLVTLVPEKQAGIIENNAVVEEITKASDEAVEGKEVAIAVEKVECEVEKAEEHPASDENVKSMDPAEQVMDSEEKEESKEPLTSKDVLPSAPSEEITPAGATDKCDEAQTEEKAEEAAKLEKEDEKDDEMREGEETEGSEEEDKTEEDEDKAEEEKENDSTVEEKESEDEVGNLELAWDMLELAKVIYKRQDTKEAQLFAAQAHLKLGEVSIESENYVQAIEEFHSCLNLQQKYLEAHDRLLAETHYHLGLAYHYNNQYEEAVQQFSRSMDVINKRLEMLTECLKSKGEGSTEDEKEIEELKGLLPEIKEKIEDSKESQKSARVAEIALQATLVGGSSSSFSQGTESGLASTIPVGQKPDGASQCITDISHLVRKKTEGRPQVETVQSAV
ncbi:nuclear autoantigenic sperm protein isoform X2 [Anolis sagrei]|uniref:nuclear autoantigenic sperm protein isoform X2 n=1 Tax=Anolis sagrei TaxID=38937 RepID=UPI003521D7FE